MEQLEAALAESRRKAQEVEDLRARLGAAEAEKATFQGHQQEVREGFRNHEASGGDTGWDMGGAHGVYRILDLYTRADVFIYCDARPIQTCQMVSWRERVALLQQENERLKSAAAAAGEQGRQMEQAQAEVGHARSCPPQKGAVYYGHSAL